MKKKLYEKPAMRVVELQQQAPLMQFSHSGYGAGGDGQAITDIFRISVTDLSTKDNVIVIMPSTQSAVYVAMKPTSNTVKFLVARSDGTPYSKVAVASLQAGKFYHPTLSATLDDAITTPLAATSLATS